MASPRKNQAISAPVEAPASFEAPPQFETLPQFEAPASAETTDPIAEAAAFAEASAAAAPVPAFIETSAPVKAAVAIVESAAATTARIVPPEVGKMFEAPVKSMTEMQEKMRAMIEKGIAETRGAYTKAKSAADETNSALEASFVTAKTGAVEINAKVLEALRVSADANFDFVKSILGVKSIADYVTLHSEFARKQIETLTGQTKEIAALAQKVATETAEPIKTRVAKTFKIAS
jgi:phasin